METSATRRAQLDSSSADRQRARGGAVEAGDQHTLDTLRRSELRSRSAPTARWRADARYVVVKLQRKAQIYVDSEARGLRHPADAGLPVEEPRRARGPQDGRDALGRVLRAGLRSELPIVAGKASRAGVTIYTVDARGTAGTGARTVADASVPARQPVDGGDTAEEGLNLLAAETGGLPSGTPTTWRAPSIPSRVIPAPITSSPIRPTTRRSMAATARSICGPRGRA